MPKLLAALACVDAVVIFDERPRPTIIAALQPDVLVKGADWAARRHRRPRHGRGPRRASRADRGRAGLLDVAHRGADAGDGRRMALSATSSLSLRALLFGAIERFRAGARLQHFSGVTPPAVALALSTAARRSPVLVDGRPADRDIDPLFADIRFFASTSKAGARRTPSASCSPARRLNRIPIGRSTRTST